MKDLMGIQLGNYLKVNKYGLEYCVKVCSLTNKKIGFYIHKEEDESYSYLMNIYGIPIKENMIIPYLGFIDDYKFVADTGELMFIPLGSTDIYKIKYFHEFQNILGLHNIQVEWKEPVNYDLPRNSAD